MSPSASPSPYRLPASLLALSGAGLLGIALHEGYRELTYVDAAGVPTVGYGSTQVDGKPPPPSLRMSPERALVQLHVDAAVIEQQLRRCIGETPLAPNEWDAYVSLSYNIGAGAFCGSTLVRLLKQTPPDYASACGQILRWNRGGGRVLPGLVKRRQAEYHQCLGEPGTH